MCWLPRLSYQWMLKSMLPCNLISSIGCCLALSVNLPHLSLSLSLSPATSHSPVLTLACQGFQLSLSRHTLSCSVSHSVSKKRFCRLHCISHQKYTSSAQSHRSSRQVSLRSCQLRPFLSLSLTLYLSLYLSV